MAGPFKAAVHRSDLNKNRGSWTMTPPDQSKFQAQTGPFFSLPTEVRDKVYEHLFVDVQVEMVNAPRITRPADKVVHCRNPLRKNGSFVISMSVHSDRSPVAFLRTCHAASEALWYFCRNATFRIYSPKRLVNFVTAVPASELRQVKRLTLDHHAYGPPPLTTDLPFKIAADRAWDEACKAASAALPGLEELEIRLHVSDVPFRFSLSETWVRALLHFHTSKSPRLNDVRVMVNRQRRNSFTFEERRRDPNGAHRETAYKLFEEVIERKIRGWDDDDALRYYREWYNADAAHRAVQFAVSDMV